MSKKRLVLLLALVCVVVSLPSCGGCGGSDDEQREQRLPQTTETADGPDLPGNWSRVRIPKTPPRLAAEQERGLARLQTLGYVSGSRTPVTDQVITVWDRRKAFAGLNFYVSAHAPEAILMDMDGKERHRWNFPLQRAFPNLPLERLNFSAKEYWRRAYLFENGDLLAIFESAALLKIDKDSNLLWATKNYAHHDLEVVPNGNIYVLVSGVTVLPPSMPVAEDFICVLDSRGKELNRVSVLACVGKLANELGVVGVPVNLYGEITHTNTLEVLDGRAERLSPAFKAGNVLISMRDLNLLAVVDLEKEEFVWHLASGPPLEAVNRQEKGGDSGLAFAGQHDPRILPGGNMLLFDNYGRANESTIWEFNPVTREVSWFYRGDEEHPFFTHGCGTAQRLPNGNTLITESDNGRAFEVTPDKEIVWEFYNPHRAGENREYIAMLAELVRLPPEFPQHWARSDER